MGSGAKRSLGWIAGILVTVWLVWSVATAFDAALAILGLVVLFFVLRAGRFLPVVRNWLAEERRARHRLRNSGGRVVVPAMCAACGEGTVLKMIDRKGRDVSRPGEFSDIVCSSCGQPAGDERRA